jgi:hypothetical protein
MIRTLVQKQEKKNGNVAIIIATLRKATSEKVGFLHAARRPLPVPVPGTWYYFFGKIKSTPMTHPYTSESSSSSSFSLR